MNILKVLYKKFLLKMKDIFYQAIYKGDLSELKSAVNSGIDIKVDINYSYAVKTTIEKDYTEIAKYLLEIGTDFNRRFEGALVWASRKGKFDIVKYCVEKGANIEFQDGTPTRLALEFGHVEILKFFEDQGVKIKVDNWSLTFVSRKGYLDMVKYLVENKGVNCTGNNNLALKYASKKDYLEVIKYLIVNGCDFKCLDAEFKKHDELVKMLYDEGHFNLASSYAKYYNCGNYDILKSLGKLQSLRSNFNENLKRNYGDIMIVY